LDIEHIFRAYDIRGIVGKNLLPDVILKASAIFANIITEKGGKKVAVGGDIRISTPSLVYAAMSGIIAAGVDVYLTYPLPIPVFCNFIWQNKNIHGGAFITASHNPPQYNGVRFRRGDGTGFSHENIEIKKRFFKNRIKFVGWADYGTSDTIQNEEVIDMYLEFIASRIPKPDRSIRVIIDGKHGAANLVSLKLFAQYGHETIALNSIIDGTFPTGIPDPLHGDVSQIKNLMITTKAPIGIAYDGDGDRAAFFDEKGRLVPSEIIGLFLAENLLKANDVIVYNTMCSSMLRRRAEEMGFKTVECRVGDVFMAEATKIHNAKLGIEESYHFFLPIFGFHYDDAIMASIIVTNLLASMEKSLAKIHDYYGPIFTIRQNIQVDDKVKFEIIEKFKKWATSEYSDVSTIDGVKIYLENGSFLARPSNTEPLIRIVADGECKDIAEEILRKFTKKLKEIITNFSKG